MNRNIIIAVGVGALIICVFFINKTTSKKPEVLNDNNSAAVIDPLKQQTTAPAVINALKEHQLAEELKQNGNYEEAKKTYQKILTEQPDYENIESIQKELEAMNMKMVLTPTPSPYSIEHVVVTGDTLGAIAKKYSTTVELIKVRNNLTKDIIRLGQKLSVWKAPFNIFVDKSQNILMLKTENEVLKVYRISTGSNNSTPIGDYTITTKLVDPVWFNKGMVVPPDSPQNVLGTRWMGFNLSGYGIHGTVEPETIGQQVTAGCVRMRNPEVEELYDIVPAGTKVTIVD